MWIFRGVRFFIGRVQGAGQVIRNRTLRIPICSVCVSHPGWRGAPSGKCPSPQTGEGEASAYFSRPGRAARVGQPFFFAARAWGSPPAQREGESEQRGELVLLGASNRRVEEGHTGHFKSVFREGLSSLGQMYFSPFFIAKKVLLLLVL